MTASIRPQAAQGHLTGPRLCVHVPRSLTGKFLPDSVIDSVLRLQHLRIRAGLNEVWLPTTAQEFKHTWDTQKG